MVCKPFHLSGISLESSVENINVLTYCRLKKVTLTSWFPIRTRRRGTQSMKLFAEAVAGNVLLGDGFWPDFVRCRSWLKDPPSLHRANSSTEVLPPSTATRLY